MESPNLPEQTLLTKQTGTSPFVIVWAFVFTLLWSFLIAVSLFWNIHNIQNQILALATEEAKTTWNKDQAFRVWATKHGGLYVEPDDRTPPNPYLAHVPNRDITTTNGSQLTLMNPAYMMRQMIAEYEEDYGRKGKITGRILLNPINEADEWELNAIAQFDTGVQEVLEQTEIDGQPYVRLMRPMIMKAGCVKCHGHLGFKEGDIRGGVSVSIPLIPYMNQAKASIESVELTHGIIWLLGCSGIFIFSVYARRHNNEMASQQQRLEIIVQQRTQELIEKEQRLSKIMDTAVDSIVTANDRGKIESFNRASERMFGYKAEDVIGKSINILMTKTDSGLHDSHLDRYQKTGQARIIGVGREVMAKDIHGREFPIELSISELRSSGKVIFTSFMHDISQRKAHEQALFSAKEAAENANQAKSEFLSSMSHELRTPLNAILGFSQMLTLDPDQPLTEDQALAVEHIQAGGEHLLALIDQVLDLAKVEAGKMEVSLESLNTHEVMNECLNMIEAQANMRSISLIKDYQLPAETLIQADYTRLKQVMLNLLSNAVKYNKEGGTITLIAYEFNERAIHLEVKDTGPGIPLDKQAGLFEPFNRLGADSSEVSGTGIGLTISKKLIESMQGRIGFSSRPGAGSSFWVELPLGNTNIDGNNSTLSKLSTQLPDLQGTILYVEDNPGNIKLMESLLSKLPDITLFVSTNAEDGLIKAVEKSPDLIIMDINLPGMNGMEALELLKEMEETVAIPVIALSASATSIDMKAGLTAGFNDYLTKPIQLPQVLSVLEKHLMASGDK